MLNTVYWIAIVSNVSNRKLATLHRIGTLSHQLFRSFNISIFPLGSHSKLETLNWKLYLCNLVIGNNSILRLISRVYVCSIMAVRLSRSDLYLCAATEKYQYPPPSSTQNNHINFRSSFTEPMVMMMILGGARQRTAIKIFAVIFAATLKILRMYLDAQDMRGRYSTVGMPSAHIHKSTREIFIKNS